MIIKRNFWNLAKSQSVGFIESIYKSGFLFHSEYVSFRETNSSMANGRLISLCIDKLPYQDRAELESILTRKIPVYIESSIDLVSPKLNRNIIFPNNANRIMPLSRDLIYIKINSDGSQLSF
jgi:hypothetical protein